jgi:hypothetical protein
MKHLKTLVTVGADQVSLNLANIPALQAILKSYKVK